MVDSMVVKMVESMVVQLVVWLDPYLVGKLAESTAA